MNKKSDSTIARRLASQYWGPVQSQKKIADGVWVFTTGGHGGIVVDVDKHPELGPSATVFINSRSNLIWESEQHFAPFEEDCEYAKPLWLIPEARKNIEKWSGHPITIEHLRDSLECWNKEWLDAHPVPVR